MKVSKRLLAIIATGIVVAIILVVIANCWNIVLAWLASESVGNWLIPVVVGVIATIIASVLLAISSHFLKPRLLGTGLHVRVENCEHFIGHSLEQKEATGTTLNVRFLIENNGEETQLTAVRLTCKSKKYPYETAPEKPRRVIILPHKRQKPYNHSFFINKHEILEARLKCVFRLSYVHGEKKISYTSTRRQVK